MKKEIVIVRVRWCWDYGGWSMEYVHVRTYVSISPRLCRVYMYIQYKSFCFCFCFVLFSVSFFLSLSFPPLFFFPLLGVWEYVDQPID